METSIHSLFFGKTPLTFVPQDSKNENELNSVTPLSDKNTSSIESYLPEQMSFKDNSRQQLEERKSLRFFLFQSTRSQHGLAKQNIFLKNLTDGKFCARALTRYFCNLYVIHKALEKIQEVILKKYQKCSFIKPELYRTEALLKAIKIWSQFNDLKERFEVLDIHSQEFTQNIYSCSEPSVKDFSDHIEMLIKENTPLAALGSIYALYGTVMSGGQEIKTNMIEAFKERHSEKPETIDQDAKESAIFYDLPFDVDKFKDSWRQDLDNLCAELKISEKEIEEFYKNLKSEAVYAMQMTLKFIEEMDLNKTC